MILGNLSPDQIKRMEYLIGRNEEQKAKQAEEERRNAGKVTPIIQPANPITPTSNPQTPAIITPSSKYWTLDNVQYKGQNCTVELARELLDGGNYHTQDDWADISLKARTDNQLYTPDMPLFHGIAKSLYLTRTNPAVEEIRQFIKTNARVSWLMTLTRLQYKPGEKDRVIHNYKQGNSLEYSMDENFVGKNDEIKDLNEPQVFQAILGDSNVQQISEIYSWINDTESYLWRVNSKPNTLDEKVAGFGAGSGRAGLDCYRSPAGASSSLGVRFARAKNSGGNP